MSSTKLKGLASLCTGKRRAYGNKNIKDLHNDILPAWLEDWPENKFIISPSKSHFLQDEEDALADIRHSLREIIVGGGEAQGGRRPPHDNEDDLVVNDGTVYNDLFNDADVVSGSSSSD